jgi:uncharacterized protein YkwD
MSGVKVALEELEPRCLLSSGYQPSGVEQEFLERLNDARANPSAYGISVGLDLSNVAPSPPLTFDTRLIQAARDHSQDMNDRNYFSNNTPEGLSPGDRMRNAGFNWASWGESIAAGYTTPEAALAGLIIDSGHPGLEHRRHLLAIDDVYKNMNQAGVGIVLGGSGSYHNYYTIDTASTWDSQPFLTGVVFSDNNNNGLYDAGEGLANVTITVAGVGSFPTLASGGYSVQVNPGTYTVTASGGGLAAPLTKTVTVGTTNYRLNFNIKNFVGDPVPVQVVNDASGRPELFALGLDDQVWAQKFDAAGNSASAYFVAGEGQVKAFAVGHDGFGNPELFVIGLNDRVYAQKFNSNGDPLGSYVFTTEGQVKAIAVGHDGFDRPELFVIGLDDQVWAQKLDAFGNSASGYFFTRPGKVVSEQVGQAANGNPVLFVLQTDWQVYGQRLDAQGNPISNYFLVSQGQVKSFTVGHDGNDNPEIFVIGLNDEVYAQTLNSKGNVGGMYAFTTEGAVKAIRAGSDAFNNPELFVIGLNDEVYTQKFNSAGGSVSGYIFTKETKVKSIAMANDAYQNPELFAIATDDQVWAQQFDAQGDSASNYWLTQVGRVK